jgi:drug/metabolite transporter (DMT)-like permease
LISALAFGSQSTISYYLTTKENLNSSSLVTVFHAIIVIISIFLLIIGYFIQPKNVLNIIKGIKDIFTQYPILVFLAGLFAASGNVLLYDAYSAGPNVNPGVMTAISNGSIILALVLPVIFYRKTINIRQIIGIIVLLFSFVMLGDDKFKGFGDLFKWFDKKQS